MRMAISPIKDSNLWNAAHHKGIRRTSQSFPSSCVFSKKFGAVLALRVSLFRDWISKLGYSWALIGFAWMVGISFPSSPIKALWYVHIYRTAFSKCWVQQDNLITFSFFPKLEASKEALIINAPSFLASRPSIAKSVKTQPEVCMCEFWQVSIKRNINSVSLLNQSYNSTSATPQAFFWEFTVRSWVLLYGLVESVAQTHIFARCGRTVKSPDTKPTIGPWHRNFSINTLWTNALPYPMLWHSGLRRNRSSTDFNDFSTQQWKPYNRQWD